MFKLFVLAAVLAVVAAAPGGWTGVPVAWGHGPIVAPAVLSVAPAYHAHVVAQPVAPRVHVAPIVTKTVLAGHVPHAATWGLHG